MRVRLSPSTVVHLESLPGTVGAVLTAAATALAALHECGVEVAWHAAETAAACHWHHAHSYNKQKARVNIRNRRNPKRNSGCHTHAAHHTSTPATEAAAAVAHIAHAAHTAAAGAAGALVVGRGERLAAARGAGDGVPEADADDDEREDDALCVRVGGCERVRVGRGGGEGTSEGGDVR